MFHLERNLENELSHSSPDWSIYAKFSTISLSIDLDQYKLIRGILDQNIGEKPPVAHSTSTTTTSTAAIVQAQMSSNSNFIINNPKIETVLSGQVWNVIRLCFELENVGIDFVVNGMKTTEATTTNSLLACMSFIKSCLIFESFSDGSKFTDLVSNEIGIRDSRSNELLSKKLSMSSRISHDDEESTNNPNPSNLQLEVHYRSNKNANRFSVLFNNCRCVCVLGWLLRAKAFLTSYTNEDDLLVQHAMSATAHETKISTETKLNLTNTDFLVVDEMSSRAIMLRLTAFLEYNERRGLERIVESCLQSVEVFACRVDDESIEKTAVSIVDPMIVNLIVKRKGVDDPGQPRKPTDEFVAECSMDVLRMQVSYLDVYFFRRIFDTIKQQFDGNTDLFNFLHILTRLKF